MPLLLGDDAVTIENGLFVGQIKVLLFSGGLARVVLSGVNVKAQDIALSSLKTTAILLWDGTYWWPIGGTAEISG